MVLIYGNLIVGSISTGIIILIILIYLITQPIFIKIDDNSIKVLTIFGFTKKEKHLKDLHEIYVDFLKVGGRNGDDYFCLNFNSRDYELNSFEDSQNQADLITFCYSKKGEKIIRKYSNLEIVDKRKN